jgi:hypothetical protein
MLPAPSPRPSSSSVSVPRTHRAGAPSFSILALGMITFLVLGIVIGQGSVASASEAGSADSVVSDAPDVVPAEAPPFVDDLDELAPEDDLLAEGAEMPDHGLVRRLYPIILLPGFGHYFRHPCNPYGRAPGIAPPGPPGVPTPGAGTVQPMPTQVPVPSPTAGGRAQSEVYQVCPQMKNEIPQAVQDLATNEPWRFYGYGQRSNPNIPYHPFWNGYRKWLSLRDMNSPYSICNYPVFKTGCP